MKVRIKNWDDAVKAALADSEDWFVEDDNIFSLVARVETGAWWSKGMKKMGTSVLLISNTLCV